MSKEKKDATASTPAASLRSTIRSSWDKNRKNAKSKSMKEFDSKAKKKVSKGGYGK
jgi:hypothetical protein